MRVAKETKELRRAFTWWLFKQSQRSTWIDVHFVVECEAWLTRLGRQEFDLVGVHPGVSGREQIHEVEHRWQVRGRCESRVCFKAFDLRHIRSGGIDRLT